MEDEMSRGCITHGWEEKLIYGFGGKTRQKETTRKP
jgi:hypothetical protein